jgi:hypothetical protein
MYKIKKQLQTYYTKGNDSFDISFTAVNDGRNVLKRILLNTSEGTSYYLDINYLKMTNRSIYDEIIDAMNRAAKYYRTGGVVL